MSEANCSCMMSPVNASGKYSGLGAGAMCGLSHGREAAGVNLRAVRMHDNGTYRANATSLEFLVLCYPYGAMRSNDDTNPYLAIAREQVQAPKVVSIDPPENIANTVKQILTRCPGQIWMQLRREAADRCVTLQDLSLRIFVDWLESVKVTASGSQTGTCGEITPSDRRLLTDILSRCNSGTVAESLLRRGGVYQKEELVIIRKTTIDSMGKMNDVEISESNDPIDRLEMLISKMI